MERWGGGGGGGGGGGWGWCCMGWGNLVARMNWTVPEWELVEPLELLREPEVLSAMTGAGED